MIGAIGLAAFVSVAWMFFEVLGNTWGLAATVLAWFSLVLLYARPVRSRARRSA